MSRHNWDTELETLALDISQLGKQAARLPELAVLAKVNDERANVQDLLGQIAISHERGMHIIKRPNRIMSKASGAIIYWARQHLAKLKCLTDDFMMLQNRKMWLRLLQARFSQSRGEEQVTLEAKHLVDLVQRRQELAKIERNLQGELDLVSEFRKGLRVQYEAIATADQNWNAASTMNARLGVDLLDARDNPSTAALKELMKVAAIPLRHPSENAKLTRISHDLEVKSEKMAAQCTQLASLFVKKGPEAVNLNSLNQFKNMINQVKDLNSEAESTLQKLLKEQIRPSRPKIVQNASKQDKTIA